MYHFFIYKTYFFECCSNRLLKCLSFTSENILGVKIHFKFWGYSFFFFLPEFFFIFCCFQACDAWKREATESQEKAKHAELEKNTALQRKEEVIWINLVQ